MQSRANRTLISIVVGLLAGLLMLVIGQSWGPAFTFGGLIAIVVSLVLKRKFDPPLGANSGPQPTSAADVDALLVAAGSSVAEFKSSIGGIANPEIMETATRIGSNLDDILIELQQPDKRSAAPIVVDNLVEPAQSVLTEYLFLIRRAIAAATPRTATIEKSIFPQIEAASRQTLSLLKEPGKPDLDKLTRASTIPFDQAVTMPPSGTTPRGSREIDPER